MGKLKDKLGFSENHDMNFQNVNEYLNNENDDN